MRSSYVFALCGDDGACPTVNNKNSGDGSGPARIMVVACNSRAQCSGYKLTLLQSLCYQIVTVTVVTATVTVTVYPWAPDLMTSQVAAKKHTKHSPRTRT